MSFLVRVPRKASLLQSIRRIIILIFSALALAFIIRVLFFSSFIIPSMSMYPALISGDYIVVNKSIPGARVFNDFFKQKIKRGSIWRLPGFRNVSRNDVLVYNRSFRLVHGLEMNTKTYFTKRCIAVPGDTVRIHHGIYKVNGFNAGNLQNQVELSHANDDLLKARNAFESFPWDSISYNWNIKNYGPLYIPKLGEKLLIDTVNIRLYKYLIEYETGEIVKVRDSKVFLNKRILTAYKFLENYYFMAGDLVLNSNDSRYWGLLPEKYIIGKVSFILSSKDDDGHYRFNRFFKMVE